MSFSEPDLKPELMLRESSGTTIYTLGDDIIFYYPYMPVKGELDRLYCVAPNSSEYNIPCDSLEIASSRAYIFYKRNSISTHGGKRTGAGRKPSPKTKPVRLNELEQELINNFRSTDLDKKLLFKKLVKMMAVFETASDI